MRFRNTTSPTLVIIGASVRAAAVSALRAGETPWCGDLFADADLAARCPAQSVDDYPAGLEAVMSAAPSAPWMYTGGLENHPQLVARIAAQRLLYGNDAAALAAVRDPFAVAAALDRAGLKVPALSRTSAALPANGSWLLKARASCAGSGVAAWRGQPITAVPASSVYFQRRIVGTPLAALYLGSGYDSRLLGATEQLLTPSRKQESDAASAFSPPHGAAPADAFCYAGSIGPVPLDEKRTEQLGAIGRALVAAYGLRGLFGVDLIDDGLTFWPVEVNPRYPASAEILERSLAFSAVGLHIAACRDGVLPNHQPPHEGVWRGKLVVHAPCDVTIDAELTRDALALSSVGRQGADEPTVADIPRAGVRIAEGRPALTVFAAAATRAETLRLLDLAAERWRQRLAHCAQEAHFT